MVDYILSSNHKYSVFKRFDLYPFHSRLSIKQSCGVDRNKTYLNVRSEGRNSLENTCCVVLLRW